MCLDPLKGGQVMGHDAVTYLLRKAIHGEEGSPMAMDSVIVEMGVVIQAKGYTGISFLSCQMV